MILRCGFSACRRSKSRIGKQKFLGFDGNGFKLSMGHPRYFAHQPGKIVVRADRDFGAGYNLIYTEQHPAFQLTEHIGRCSVHAPRARTFSMQYPACIYLERPSEIVLEVFPSSFRMALIR